MAQYEVVRDIGESLANVVRLEAARQKATVEVLQGPPDREFYAGKTSAVAIYLHAIEIIHNPEEEGPEREEEIEIDGEAYTVLYPRPLQLALRFAVAARGRTPVDEQLALTLALKAFYEHPVLGDAEKVGENFGEQEIGVDADPQFDLETRAHLLQTLGIGHHPMLGYTLRAKIIPQRELRRRRKVERRRIEIFDRNKPPPGKGEGAERKPAAVVAPKR